MIGKRIWSLMLAVLLVVSMVPASVVTAFAEDTLSPAASPAAEKSAPAGDGGPIDPIPAGDGDPVDPAPIGGGDPVDPAPIGDGDPVDPAPIGDGDPVDPAPAGDGDPIDPAPIGDDPVDPAPIGDGDPVDPAPAGDGDPVPSEQQLKKAPDLMVQSAGVGTLGIFDWVRITFDSGYDGSKTVNWEVLLGTITVPAYEEIFPKREGYEFTGWKWYWLGIFPEIAQPGDKISLNILPKTFVAQWRYAPTAITITAEDSAVTYDGAEHTLSYTVTPPLEDGYSIEGVTGGKGTNKGTYPLDLSGAKVMKNDEDVTDLFEITKESGTLTINPCPVTLAADSKTKVYGQAEPEFTYTVTPALAHPNDLGVISVSRSNTDETAGTYPGVLVPSYTSNDNYLVTPANGDFIIQEATAPAITVTGYQGEYDGQPHGVTITGTQPGDKVEYKVGEGNWTETPPTQTDKADVTVYVRVTRPNHKERTGSATITIDPRPVTYIVANATKVYGDDDPGFSYSLDTDSLELVDPNHLGTLSVIRKTHGGNVGKYTEDLVLDYTANDNYDVTANPGDFTITPRPVTITVGSESKVYGEDDPGFSYTVPPNVLVNPDDLGTLSVARNSDDQNAGEYTEDLVLVGYTANDNYDVTIKPGNFTITPRPLTYNVANATKVYGDNDPGFSYSLAPGSLKPVEGDDLDLQVYSTIWDQRVGNHPGVLDLSYTDTHGNYAVTVNPGDFTITPRPLTIATGSRTVTGNSATRLTYDNWSITAGSVAEGDSLAVSVTGLCIGVGSAPNTATVIITKAWVPTLLAVQEGEYGPEVLDVTENYSLAYQLGTLTVNRPSRDDDDDDDDDGSITIPDSSTPLGAGTIIILDGQVPLGALPKTGSRLGEVVGRGGLMSLVLGSLLHGLANKRKDEEE